MTMTATQTEQIEASKQRDRIPSHWQVEFNTWSTSSLSSLASDPIVHDQTRAYATWELQYRMAFDHDVEDPPDPNVKGTGLVAEILRKRKEAKQ